MVRWSFWNVPLRRRLQTASVFAVSMLPMAAGVVLLICIFNFFLWPFLLLYFAWMFYDRNTPRRGGRVIQFIRSLPLWKYYREYFPAKMLRTVPLDPKKNYIFGVHPHGIISLSVQANFCNNFAGMSEHFPGLDYRLCTLDTNFNLPFVRDWLVSLGVISASRAAITSAVKKGKSVMIVVGGAAEALEAVPGTETRLVLGKRKGFVRLALSLGADLVPVYCFGENELFSQVINPEGSRLRKLQEWGKKTFGFSIPIFYGRGVFNHDVGMMPRRVPLTTVVGKPLGAPHIPEPTDKDVDKWHGAYLDALKAVFEQHKELAGVKENALRILGLDDEIDAASPEEEEKKTKKGKEEKESKKDS